MLGTDRVSAPSALASTELFGGLDGHALAEIHAAAVRREIRAGSLIVNQGEPAEHLYLINQGWAKVVRTTPCGRQVILLFIGRGNVVGIAGVLRCKPYPASTVALTDTALLGWTAAQVSRFLAHYPGFSKNAMRLLGDTVDSLAARVAELSTLPVERRLARELLRLAVGAGEPVATGIQVSFGISRQDLAELTGATIYTVSRVLSRWERRGIVDTGRQRVIVCDQRTLASIAWLKDK